MSKFKLNESVLYRNRVYKIHEITQMSSIDKGECVFYTLRDKNLGTIERIYEDSISKKPKYTITIDDGSCERVLYADDMTEGLETMSTNGRDLELNGVPIDLILGIKLRGVLSNE